MAFCTFIFIKIKPRLNFGEKFSCGRGLAYIGINLSQYYNFFNDKMQILYILTIIV
jgi:hypothetical protein